MRASQARLRVAEAMPTREGLYERFSPYVARLAFRLVGRDGDVDDLVQDTFLEAFRDMPEVPDAEQARRWLATVTVRLAGRRLRRRRIATFLGLDDGAHDDEHLLAPGASPETQAMVARVFEVLGGLPVRQRLAWTLRHVEGEALEDVARLCACSLATAKRDLGAANDALAGGPPP
jgi:RNA polymerase sigma-70 factor, ECF subfamily